MPSPAISQLPEHWALHHEKISTTAHVYQNLPGAGFNRARSSQRMCLCKPKTGTIQALRGEYKQPEFWTEREVADLKQKKMGNSPNGPQRQDSIAGITHR